MTTLRSRSALLDRCRLATPMLCVALLLAATLHPASAQEPAGMGQIGAMKEQLEEGLAKQRAYEWIETTTVFLDDEAKSTQQKRCYYGADGQIQKLPIAGAGAEDDSGRRPRGIRGRVVERKQADMQETMESTMALIRRYVPPDPNRIEAAKDSGRLLLSPPDRAGKMQIVIRDYVRIGDTLTLRIDAASRMVETLDVATLVEDQADAVGLTTTMGSLPDGAIYPAKTVLDITEEDLRVVVENTGYRLIRPTP